MTAPVEPLLGLVMIVRNEAHGLAATLQPLLDAKVIDRWTILDTGSTDGTDVLTKAALAEIPGELHQAQWTDFSTARNLALDLHGTSTQFALMLDADDVVLEPVAMRAGLMLMAHAQSLGEDIDPAFLIAMRAGTLDYSLPLLINTAKAPRYRGRVHECLQFVGRIQVPGRIEKRPSEESVAATQARWLRDLEVLTEDVSKDRGDARAMFYLAQTYECLGLTAAAAARYTERSRMPGWPDEAYEAAYRAAKLTMRLQHPGGVADLFAAAHLLDPRRAEPLYEIALLHYGKDQHALTYLYASRAAQLPKPVTSMFVHHEVYDYLAADLVAISAFYLVKVTGEASVFEAGQRASERCIKARPDDGRMRTNRAHYAPQASDLFTDVEIVPVDYKPEAPYHAGTPSIAVVDGSLLCILRTCNYQIVNGEYLTPDNNVIYTKNVMLELAPDLSVTRAVPMRDLPLERGDKRTEFPVHGYEDCRLIKAYDSLYATATVCDFPDAPKGDGAREIALLSIDPTTYEIRDVKPMRHKAWSHEHQKNWMPIHGRGRQRRLAAVYAVDPAVEVVDLRSPAGPHQTIRPLALGRLRGGSQLVAVPGHPDNDSLWICIVHDVVFPGGRDRIYLHRFVAIALRDGALVIDGMSDPFFFKQRGIEFCAGLALCGGRGMNQRLIASFSVNDSAAYFATFDLDDVLAKCKTEYVI